MSTPFPALSETAMTVLRKRYLQKDSNGEVIETPEEMFKRVAEHIDGGEGYAISYYKMMSRLEFLPNSPTLMNAGTGRGTMSACFVLPLGDSMEEIMQTATDAAMVQKFGGGTGFSLSRLRERGAPIASTHGIACGPVAVLRVLSSVSTMVTQGGKRDGANMAVMSVHHPDIMEFIECKTTEGDIHNFNISVGVTDAFMEAVKKNANYSIISPKTGKPVGGGPARPVWDAIIAGAHKNGEPGVIFLDVVNAGHPGKMVGEIEATNPCGEQPLLPNESCNLGSIDVGKFVDTRWDRTDEFTKYGPFDWERLRETVQLATRFLDNIIDKNEYATPAIEKATKHTRKIGLGVMGFADALVRLGVPYGSPEGVMLGRMVMKFIDETARHESVIIGKEKGSAPALAGTADFVVPRRNVCVTSIAPTGTISMIAGASSGCEPLFDLAFTKHNVLEGESFFFANEDFRKAIYAAMGEEDGQCIIEEIANGQSLLEFDGVPDEIKSVFVTSDRLSPKWHVAMQAAFQAHCDSGVSKTINMPNSATPKDVEDSYISAWERGCKGITVYRAGSREKEVLVSIPNDSKIIDVQFDAVKALSEGISIEIPDELESRTRERPDILSGRTYKRQTGKGVVYVTVNEDEAGIPFEVFATIGKSGDRSHGPTEAITRMASLAMRNNVNVEDIIRQLRGISDGQPAFDKGKVILSVADAIADVLHEHTEQQKKFEENLGEFTKVIDTGLELMPTVGLTTPDSPNISVAGEVCPECGSILRAESGCWSCWCGYSRC